jgi:hypothetical protein
MKGWREKQVFSRDGYQWEVHGHKERENEGSGWIWIWWMYFVYLYENRMKSVQIVLRSGERAKKKNNEGINLRYIVSTDVNITMPPLYSYYM